MEMRYRYYFLEALVLTILLFIGGFLIGLSIEKSRNLELANYYISTEDEISGLADQLDISNLGKYACSELIERNFYIGDRIYQQASIFEEYENSAILTKYQLIREHRKFDVLRTLFWINSINIKKRCGNDIFYTVVYLYDYQAEEVENVAKQKVMARIASEIKENSQNKVILIPIAKNLNISSLNALLQDYKNTNESALMIVNEDKEFLYNQTEEIRDYFEINF
jgi:hypothetical protein